MSKHKPPEPPPAPSPTTSKPIPLTKVSAESRGFKAAGMCRTAKGWAVAEVEIGDDGQLIAIRIGGSQVFPDHVAKALVRRQMALNQEVLKRYPWRPTA